MLFVLSLVLIFQDAQHVHGTETDGDKITFSPISAGNVVDIGSFSLTIPDGTLYADEANVHYMFKLAGADNIPNAVGMFASTSGTWEYSVTVQHVPAQSFRFIRLPPQIVQLFFAQNDLLTSQPVDGIANVLLEPQFNVDEQSMMLAMQYVYSNGKVVNAMKKVFVTSKDALVLTLNSSEAGFEGDFDQIDRIFGTVKVDPEVLKLEPPADAIPSYILLGMQPNFKVDPAKVNAMTEEEPEPISFVPSAILIGFAIVVLLIAMKLRGNKAKAAESE